MRSEPPTFDAAAVQAAKAAAAERAVDLPLELRFVDAPLEQLAQVAARRAGTRVPRPAETGAGARERCTAELRALAGYVARSCEPPASQLAALTALASADAPQWLVAGAQPAAAEADTDDAAAEDSSIVRAVVASAVHFAAPAEFKRFGGATARSSALGGAGLAAAALVCADERRCVRFLAAGGASVLASVAAWEEAPTRARAAAAAALARASRFAAACALLCGEWRGSGDAAAAHDAVPVSSIARLLLKPQRASVAQPATSMLMHCHVCRLAWKLRAAADGNDADGCCGEDAHALAALLAQQRDSDADADALVPREREARGEPSSAPESAAVLWLLLDARVLPSLAAAASSDAGGANSRLRSGAAALLQELAATRAGLYVIAAEADAAVLLAKALAGETAALVRAALLGVAGLEALVHGEGDAVRLGALHSLARVARTGPQRSLAALLLASPAAVDRLLHVLAAPHVPATRKAPALTHSLALELLVALISDDAPACMAAWVPRTAKLLQALQAAEPCLPPAAVAVARDWLAAGARWEERGGWAGLMTWLAGFVANSEGAAPTAPEAGAPPQPAAGDAAAGPAAAAAGGVAGMAASGFVSVLCALRMLLVAARNSPDAASKLFGMDALGVAAQLVRRVTGVIASSGVAAADDASALDEDLDVGPALGACRRCVRAAQVCAAAADVVQAVAARLHGAGVAEYRAGALVTALRDAHAAAAVQHAAGGPVAAAACAARASCAAALCFWATGPSGWQPRVLHAAVPESRVSPRAALAAALLVGDLLPPAGRAARLPAGTRAQLVADVQPERLATLLHSAAPSPSLRLHAAAVRALARLAALDPQLAASLAGACVQAVAACSAEEEAVRSRLARLVALLAGAADTEDAAALEAALRARYGAAAPAEGDAADGADGAALEVAPPVCSVAHTFCAATEQALAAGAPALTTYRVPREGVRAAEEAAKRKRILRAEVRAKRSKLKAAAAPQPEPAAPPMARRKHAAAGASRTMHVDEFQARQAALKGPVQQEPASAPPPPAPAPAPAPAPKPPAPPKGPLSIKFGAAPPAAATPAPPAAPAAEPLAPAWAVAADAAAERLPFASQADEAPAYAMAAQPQPQPQFAQQQQPPPQQQHAQPSMIPGLGYAAVPPPVYAQHGLPAPAAPQPPQPPRGPPPAAQAPPQPAVAAWGQQHAAPAHGQPRGAPSWDELPDAQPYAATAAQQQPAAAPAAAQQPSALLLQQLSSPEAIASLLNDPPRLRALLEQFPALASMLQARLRS